MATLTEEMKNTVITIRQLREQREAIKKQIAELEKQIRVYNVSYNIEVQGKNLICELYIGDGVRFPKLFGEFPYKDCLAMAHKYLIEHYGGITHDQDGRLFHHDYQSKRPGGFLAARITPKIWLSIEDIQED